MRSTAESPEECSDARSTTEVGAVKSFRLITRDSYEGLQTSVGENDDKGGMISHALCADVSAAALACLR